MDPAPPSSTRPRQLFILTETASGGCCCYGGDEVKSKAYATLNEARAALRASLAKCCPYAPDADSPRALCEMVYTKTYAGPPAEREATIAALYRGEAVEEQFDFYKLNVRDSIMNYDLPLWEETWDMEPTREGKVAGGCCKISVPISPEDHGGMPRVTTLAITEVELPVPSAVA